ncbi:hypothetical protein AYX15_02003 [Cryptococcus neoformans]|nr:hypothetical protein AYX15_02003 [Cryptococcus neoformans var. grubii]
MGSIKIHVPLDAYNNANRIDRQRTPCLPAATGFGLINNSDKENLGGGSTSAAESNALALEQEVSRSVPAPIIHFFNHPSLVKRQSTVKESVAPAVATPRPSSNSSLIDSNNNHNHNPLNPLNRAYVNAFDLIMRHRNSGGEGARSMGTMNGSTAHHIGSGEGEKVSVGNAEKPVDEELTPKSNLTIPSKLSKQKSIHGSETTSPSTSSLCLSPATSYDSDSSLGHDLPLAEKGGQNENENENKEHAEVEGALGLSTGLFVRSRGLDLGGSDEEKEEEEEGNNVREDVRHQRTAQLSGFASCLFTAHSSESEGEDLPYESDHDDQDDVESIASSSSSSSSSNRRRPNYSSIHHSVFVSQSHESSDSGSDMGADSDSEDGDTGHIQDDDALYLPESPWLIQSSLPMIPKDNNSPSKSSRSRSTSPPSRTIASPLSSASSPPQPRHRISTLPSQSQPRPQPQPQFQPQPQHHYYHQTPPNHIQPPPSPHPIQRYILTEAPALPVYERYRPIPIRVPVLPCPYSYSNMIMYSCYSHAAGGPVEGDPSGRQPQEQVFGQGKREMSEQERLDEEWARKEERKLREEEEERLRIRRYAAEYSSPRLY